MGNQAEKEQYVTINENMVTCKDFDDMVIDKTKPSNKIDTFTKHKLLSTLIDTINKSKDIANDVFNNYDEEIILDYYESTECLEILQKNDKKAKQLAQLLPPNKRMLAWKYFRCVPANLIIVMTNSINFNLVNKNNETFLFQKIEGYAYSDDIKKHINHICFLLKNIDSIDVNLRNNRNMTFFEYLINNSYIKGGAEDIELIELLEQKKYNFNKINSEKTSCLTYMLRCNSCYASNFAQMIRLESYDIALESRWLYHLLNKDITLNSYVNYMFTRKKHDDLILRFYTNLYIDVWGDKFIVFLQKIADNNKAKCIECLNYRDENDDTVVHHMARAHDKQTLLFTIRYFKVDLIIKPNKDNKMPLDLYEESSLKNLLKY